jgi:hypothetical protein
MVYFLFFITDLETGFLRRKKLKNDAPKMKNITFSTHDKEDVRVSTLSSVVKGYQTQTIYSF